MSKNKAYANLLPRLSAQVIDACLLNLLNIAGLYWMANASSIPELVARLVMSIALIFIPTWILTVAYYVKLLSDRGKTIGKELLGLEVVDKKGKFLNWKWAFFREFPAKAVSWFFFGLGFWWVIKDKQRRAWHDLLTGSYVKHQHQHQLSTGLVVALVLLGLNLFGYFLIFKIVTGNQALIGDFQQLLSRF
ncbi:MAG: hypothetical protein GF390_04100 [Candidatus Pacebacteria bacterium]|nr:hypothetical protein [Candidatus Paceibacterota bacterium]